MSTKKDINIEEIMESLNLEDKENSDFDYIADILPLDCSELCSCTIDKPDFQRGINDFSYVCGAITALTNSGLSPEQALDYITNRETMEHNMKISELTANTNIECAKYASVKLERESL